MREGRADVGFVVTTRRRPSEYCHGKRRDVCRRIHPCLAVADYVLSRTPGATVKQP